MKAKFLKPLFYIVFTVILVPGYSAGQNLKSSDNEIGIISKMMDLYESKDLFSGVVLLAKNNKIIFQKTYGFADKENKIPNTINTQYRLASVGKLFTIAAICKLYDEGKLDFSDKIGKYLDGFSKEISEKVTITHLIKMTSGFGDYLRNEEFRKNRSAFKTVNDLLRIVEKENLAFEPGTDIMYSNSGFVVLGGIIEKISGKSYFEYVKENILIPSGMEHTYFPDSSENKNEAFRYNRNILGEFKKLSTTYPATPAGNACSSLEDLLKFVNIICKTNDILSDNAKEMCFIDVRLNYVNDSGKWVRSQSEPIKVFGWTGGLPGISTVLGHILKDNLTVIILSNYSDISPEAVDNILSIMISGKHRNVKIPLTETVYKAFAEKGIDFVKNNFREWTKDCTDTSQISGILNEIGYEFIKRKNYQDALAFFKLNTELFPSDANTWDSLGEAYMVSGNTVSAIENYEKSLSLNPENENAVNKLKELKDNR
jgi:CubicO group peptidase (beta-lactamase class C family)